MEAHNLHKLETAGFLRRLMSNLYDWLLVLAIMMVVSVPVVAVIDDAIAPGNAFYRLTLALVAAAFFIFFWSHGGQTLGMKAWRLKLVNRDGTAANTKAAAQRFIFACLALLPAGLGFVWLIWDRDKLSWQDRLSKTRVVLLPREKSRR